MMFPPIEFWLLTDQIPGLPLLGVKQPNGSAITLKRLHDRPYSNLDLNEVVQWV